jgi:hypothetical protein
MHVGIHIYDLHWLIENNLNFYRAGIIVASCARSRVEDTCNCLVGLVLTPIEMRAAMSPIARHSYKYCSILVNTHHRLCCRRVQNK